MLAGASGIDAALLVVALDDGVMPQTREHVQILELLGIDRGVVALTKADHRADRVADVAAQVRSLLAEHGAGVGAVVAGIGDRGRGDRGRCARRCMAWVRARATRDRYPRLAVDRAFTLAGAGLVVTGTLVSGRIRVEDRLMLSPPGIELRVRGLHAQNRPADEAAAGQRVALNVVGPRLSKDAVTRGDWVLHPDVHAPTDRLDVRVRLLAEEKRCVARGCAGASASRRRACDGARCAAGSRPHRAGCICAGATDARSCRSARLAGDRLVLRDATATRTIGGGVVIDPFPPRRGRRTPERLARLVALEQAEPATALARPAGAAAGLDRTRQLLPLRATCRRRGRQQ